MDTMGNGTTGFPELGRLASKLCGGCVLLFLCLFLKFWEPWLFWFAGGSFVLWLALSPRGLLYVLAAALGLSLGLGDD
ncbi:MAG: hypothetical protein ACREVY_15785 [Gammaproteobacteria bacterium]